ncbi:MAG: ABC transporter ATP-binding protein [Euzebya sp.]
MIRFRDVTIAYADSTRPALRDVDLHIPEGEFCVVVGSTGVGKSTLLGAINGLVPHFTGGTLSGSVTIAGRDTRTAAPRDLADVVGTVGQDPLAGFVTETVEDELAFTMEQLGIAPAVMRKRVEETLDLLGLADLRGRSLRTLSGGQQQRVAIGAVLTAHPQVLVLDEPTSALDPTAAEEVLASIARLVHDLGVTAVVAEHRLERILQFAEHAVEVRADGTVVDGPAGTVMQDSAVVPPVVELGRLAGWDPVPLTVRDARRQAQGLRERLLPQGNDHQGSPRAATPQAQIPLGGGRGVVVRHGQIVAVSGVDLDLLAGQVVALMGRNGSGKSSLLWALQGSGRRDGGQVLIAGSDPARLSPAEARALIGLVPQTPTDLLYLATVSEECAQADREAAVPAGTCRDLLDDLVGGIAGDSHPRDLSEGQRLALVLAIQLTASPDVVLLDEPTRGLDYRAKAQLTRVLDRLAGAGAAVVISTHDVEFVATTCDRIIVMAQGEIVADGPSQEVLLASPAFAPQITKVLRPDPWLNVRQVRDALAATHPVTG